MSDPIDIKALDEYLKGSSDVSGRYRELGRDEVPPELDRRVLAAAREAVANEGTQRSRSWLRWSAPVALAASVVLVVTVVLENGVQKDAPVVTQAPAGEERKLADELSRQRAADSQEPTPVYVQPVQEQVTPPAFAPDAPAPAELAAAKAEALPVAPPPPPITVDQPEGLRDQESTVATVAAPAAAPPAQEAVGQVRGYVAARESVERKEAEADSSADLQEVSANGTRTRRAAGGRAGPRNTISTNGLTSESRPVSDERADRSNPEAWLEEIRELRRTGKITDADREWDLFREAFPEFRVADDDIARKKP